MPEFRTFFRHCPACGRRFEIRLVSKVLEKEDSRVVEPGNRRAWGSRGWTVGIELRENTPVLIDRRLFNYCYKCKHCGHEWSEVHTREAAKSVPDDYPQEWSDKK